MLLFIEDSGRRGDDEATTIAMTKALEDEERVMARWTIQSEFTTAILYSTARENVTKAKTRPCDEDEDEDDGTMP